MMFVAFFLLCGMLLERASLRETVQIENVKFVLRHLGFGME